MVLKKKENKKIKQPSKIKSKKITTRVSSRAEQVKHQTLSSHESKLLKMNMGKKDEDVYSEEGEDDLLENDEIDAAEAGYVRGGESVYKPESKSSAIKKKKKRLI